MARVVEYQKIVEEVAKACMEANYYLPEDVIKAYQEALKKEISPLGKSILEELLENAKVASENKMPVCQDTGTAVFYVIMGEEVEIKGGSLKKALNEGVRKGYKEGYLRKSIVKDPLRRENTGDNTPAIIHIELVEGDRFEIYFAPKGGGSENQSAVRMMAPAAGRKGIIDFAVERVKEGGANACPPLILGIGIGGNFEYSAFLAKKALLTRNIGERNPDPYYAELELEILKEVNKTGVGPAGYGGRITVIDVFIETYPCHIASMPVAINIQCNAARHKKIVF